MKLSGLLVLTAILALIYGLGFLFIPATVLTIYGVSPGPGVNLVGQFLGVMLIAVGLICWLARNIPDSTTQRAIVQASLIAYVIGLIVSLRGIFTQAFNAVGWSVVAIMLVLSLGYAYFQFMKPGTAR